LAGRNGGCGDGDGLHGERSVVCCLLVCFAGCGLRAAVRGMKTGA
jgi:hypothetical protein